MRTLERLNSPLEDVCVGVDVPLEGDLVVLDHLDDDHLGVDLVLDDDPDPLLDHVGHMTVVTVLGSFPRGWGPR